MGIIFTLGDTVRSERFGVGKIVHTERHPTFPIVVDFESHGPVMFTAEGKYVSKNNPSPEFDITPYTPEQEKKEAPVLAPGENILTTSQAFWMLACTVAGVVLGAATVLALN